jgi:hypothetical protein
LGEKVTLAFTNLVQLMSESSRGLYRSHGSDRLPSIDYRGLLAELVLSSVY